jgi:hypothetical protein
MGAEERREVSERMRKYWVARRLPRPPERCKFSEPTSGPLECSRLRRMDTLAGQFVGQVAELLARYGWARIAPQAQVTMIVNVTAAVAELPTLSTAVMRNVFGPSGRAASGGSARPRRSAPSGFIPSGAESVFKVPWSNSKLPIPKFGGFRHGLLGSQGWRLGVY